MDDVVLEETLNGHDTFSDDDCIEVVKKDELKILKVIFFVRLKKASMPKVRIFLH